MADKHAEETTDWEWVEDDRSLTIVRVFWIAGVFIWSMLAAAMLSYSPHDVFGHAASVADGQATGNWIGAFGAAISSEIAEMVGVGAWLMLAMSLLALVIIGFRGPVSHMGVRALGVAAAGLAASGFHALLLPEMSAQPEGGGGLVMIYVAETLRAHAGVLGGLLTLAFMGGLGLWVALDRWVYVVPLAAAGWLGRRTVGVSRFAGERAGSWASGVADRRREQRANDIDDDQRLRSVEQFLGAAGRRAKRAQAEHLDERAGGLGGGGRFDPDTTTLAGPMEDGGPGHEGAEETGGDDTYEYDESSAEDAEGWHDDGEVHEYEDADDAPGAPQVFDRDALKEKIAKLPIRFANAEKSKATQEDLEALRAQRKSEEEADRNYRFPGLDLLEDPEENFNAELEEWVRDQAEALEEALQTYRIEGEVVGIESGPVITLYRVRLAPGTKVSQLTPVSSDIARMLKAVNIRIVPNEAGTDTVGIEVPNLKKEKVRLKELMTNSSAAGRMKLPMFLGKDASGNPLIVDLASLPHVLIAGTTGSGKSVCMNAIITGFLYTQKPSDMKLVLVDPKMVELSQFKDIPHLMCPVVTEMGKAAAILEWAVTKMDERYELLAEAGCRDISAYNALDWEELLERFNPANELEEAKIPRKLPYMVFVIDELADLMMTNKEVEGSIVRIAQKARAVGIHLVLATQRPQANVVTGLIKSNMPGRIAFKVASGMDSRIVLDQKGGELLLGHGDMLMLTPRSGTTMRAQGTLVDDAEIRKVVRFVRDVSGPTYERDLAGIENHGYGSDDDASEFTAAEYEERMRKSAEEDPLFDRAVEIVLETKRGSVSLLQRRLAIGYTRASRLIELMGMSGIIGKHKGSVAREVLMSLEEWEAMKRLAEEQRAAAEESAETLFGAMGFEGSEDAQADGGGGAPGGVGVPDASPAVGEEAPPFEPADAAEVASSLPGRTAPRSELDAAGAFEAAADGITGSDAPAGPGHADEPEAAQPAAQAEEQVADDIGGFEGIEGADIGGAEAEYDEEQDAEDAEYVYVDEDGNPIDPEDLDEEDEYEYVEEDEYEDDDPSTASRP